MAKKKEKQKSIKISPEEIILVHKHARCACGRKSCGEHGELLNQT